MSVQLPMLPTSGDWKEYGTLVTSGRWYFETKLDGVRAIIQTEAGIITNRSGTNITYRWPEISEWAKGLPPMLLDGEIVVLDNGRPSFSLTHRRDAQSARRAPAFAKAMPGTFFAFDVLEIGDRNFRRHTQRFRRGQLERLEGVRTAVGDRDGRLMRRLAMENQLEGLVAKRVDSVYTPGRSRLWLKFKLTRRISTILAGLADDRSAILVGVLRGTGLVPLGAVGSGITQEDWVELRRRALGGVPTVIEVEYLERSPSGSLRMPVFKGIRVDVEPRDCTEDQL